MKKQAKKWFRNISIRRKLFFVVGIMALLIIVELFTLWFAVRILSSVRAYVGGEGLWSKAQKDAGYYLQKYGHTHDEKDYESFKEFIKVPLGDGITRRELGKKEPNLHVARYGFLQGKNHPDDIDGMIWLIRNFSWISYIKRVIQIWGEAEPLAIQLIPIGNKLHAQINAKPFSQDRVNITLSEIDPINKKLTQLENEFSYTLGEGSRWLENLILKLLFVMALMVELTGLFLTISVSITISRGIDEVIRVSQKVATGDFSERAKIFSNDEIGLLAGSFNKMINDLQHRIRERDEAEIILREQKHTLQEYALKLEQSNKELEQFAYVASHDLREPLRTITSYVQLLESRYKDKLDGEALEFIDFVVAGVGRMDNLITDLLTYSRITTQVLPIEEVDCEEVMQIVKTSSTESITRHKAKITCDKLPIVYANKQHVTQLFQNLLNNAIKFHGEKDPEITISVKEEQDHWLFWIRDNGIGIEPKYLDKIFVIFQRLNSREVYDGTGIGLTICKKIVEQYGGKIWAESRLNEGATFYFTFQKPVN